MKKLIKRIFLINKINKAFKNNIFKDVEQNNPKKRVVVFFLCVWGEDYLDILFNFGLPALFQKNNIPGLLSLDVKIVFNIFCENKNLKRINDEISNHKISNGNMNFEIRFNPIHEKNAYIYFCKNLEFCLENSYYCLDIKPDHIFIDGHVKNSFLLAENKNINLALAHPRISFQKINKYKKSLIDFMKINKYSATSLVNLLHPLAHKKCFSNAFENLEHNTAYRGVAINEIGFNKFSVTHNLPAPYFYNFSEDDKEHFRNINFYTDHDRGWAALLHIQKRLKVIGNSNIAFYLEATHDDDGSEVSKYNNQYNDNVKNANFYENCMNSFYSFWLGSDIKKEQLNENTDN
jgi:hypothetical protein